MSAPLKAKEQKRVDLKCYRAVKAGDYKTVSKLLLQNANPNAPVGKRGMTSMHRVAAASNRKLELLLLDHGGIRVSAAAVKDIPVEDDEIEPAQDDGHEFKLGDKVSLGPEAENELDAMYGPLSPTDIGEVVGISPDLETSVQVQAPNGAKFRYTAQALMPAKSSSLVSPPTLSPDIPEGASAATSSKIRAAATGVMAMAARMEKQHAEAQQQQHVRPVREKFSRLANGTMKSRRGRDAKSSDISATSPTGDRNKAVSPAQIAAEQLKNELAGAVRSPTLSPVESPSPPPTSTANGNDTGGTYGANVDPVTLEFDRSHLKQLEQLGEGNFGVVYAGEATGIIAGKGTVRVAIKTLSSVEPDMKSEFLTEVDIMKSLNGSNRVVNLLGVCTKSTPFCMLMELMAKGDLKEVLRKNRPKKKKDSQFSWKDLCSFALDVALGMAYLSGKAVVHRDLAARNVLVNDENQAKIGDFGLTRNIYSSEYYRCTGSAPLPIRWMAPESLGDGVYTGQSDVWSYGVVLWEIASFAKLPYGLLSNMEVCEKVVEEDYRMPIPKGCPNELYTVMMTCWQSEEDDRPNFDALVGTLKNVLESMSTAPIMYTKKNITSDEGPKMSPPPMQQVDDQPEADGGEYFEPEDTLHGGDDDDDDDDDGIQTEGYLHGLDTVPAPSNYYPLAERDDVGNQQLYTDNRYEGLPDMMMAIKMAQAKRDIKDVSLEGGNSATVASSRQALEEVTTSSVESLPAGSQIAPLSDSADGREEMLTMASDAESKTATNATALASIAVEALPDWVANKREDKLGRQASQKKIEHMSSRMADMEDEIQGWIEKSLQIKLQSPLHAALKSGQILCVLLNALNPGAVRKIHSKKMAPMQRENIGWFLEGARALGVLESDLFATNDLFEVADMRQVLLCLSALKRVVERKGIIAKHT